MEKGALFFCGGTYVTLGDGRWYTSMDETLVHQLFGYLVHI